jgi:hypothetical protein
MATATASREFTQYFTPDSFFKNSSAPFGSSQNPSAALIFSFSSTSALFAS